MQPLLLFCSLYELKDFRLNLELSTLFVNKLVMGCEGRRAWGCEEWFC